MKKDPALLHPDLRVMAGRVPPMNLSRRNLGFWRLVYRLLYRGTTPRDVAIANLSIPRPDGSRFRLRTYRPQTRNGPAPALLWFHGGGCVLGRPELDEGTCLQYVREAGLVVVSVDYRLAPEHPFPAALDDGYMALQWVKSQATQLGADATRIAIGGESGGGGLAAALVQRVCDRKEIPPVFQLLVYPMLDDRTAALVNRNPFTGQHIWSHDNNRFGWAALLGGTPGAVGVSPYLAPARAADLRGLPPAIVTVGQLDLFLEEDVDYATRLMQAGVSAELHVYPRAFHGFDEESGAQIGRAMRRDRLNALRRAFGQSTA